MDGTICRRSDGPTGQKTWPADGHNLLFNCLIPPYNWNSIIHILLIKSLNNYTPTNPSISQISMRMGVVTQNSLLVSPRWGILHQKRTSCRVTSTEKPHFNFRSVLIDIHRISTAVFKKKRKWPILPHGRGVKWVTYPLKKTGGLPPPHMNFLEQFFSGAVEKTHIVHNHR